MSGFSDWVASVKERFEDAFVRDPASQRKTGLVVARTQPSLLEEKEEEEEKKPTSELFHEFLDRERIEEQQRSLGGGVTEPPAETGGEEQQRLVIQEEEALPKEGFGGEEAPASEPLYPSLAAAPVPFVPVEKPKAPAPEAAAVVVRYQWRAATDEEKVVLWLNGKWRILCVNMTIITFFAIAVFLLVLRFSYIIFRLDD